jgi:hypothetical protein
MFTIDQGNSFQEPLLFSNVVTFPVNGQYQIVDEETGTVLVPWTEYSATSVNYTIDIPSSVQCILDPYHKFEIRVLSVIGPFNSNTQQVAKEYRYRVRRLSFAFQNEAVKGKGGEVEGGTAGMESVIGGVENPA